MKVNPMVETMVHYWAEKKESWMVVMWAEQKVDKKADESV